MVLNWDECRWCSSFYPASFLSWKRGRCFPWYLQGHQESSNKYERGSPNVRSEHNLWLWTAGCWTRNKGQHPISQKLDQIEKKRTFADPSSAFIVLERRSLPKNSRMDSRSLTTRRPEPSHSISFTCSLATPASSRTFWIMSMEPRTMFKDWRISSYSSRFKVARRS